MAKRVSNRGVHKAPANEIGNLEALVDGLIRENRELKRRVAKLATSSTADLRQLGGLVRRLERGLVEAASSPIAKRTTTGRRPRKPASPEVQEKRRAALAKARAARQANRALVNAQSKLIQIEEIGKAGS
jgi:hypothetical protein